MHETARTSQTLKELVEDLPPELEQEARNYIEYLLQKHEHKPSGAPEFNWAGALRELKTQYTSVQLQHKIAEWRSGQP